MISPAKDLPFDDRRSRIDRDHPLFSYYQSLVVTLRRPSRTGDDAPQVIGLTSCFRGEGVSTVASHLAIVAAHLIDRGVLLVDAHVARPNVDLAMRVPLTPGLTDYLSDTANLPECLYPASFENLTLMPAGSSQGRTAAKHDVVGMAGLFDTLRQEFGLVIVDLPPVEELNSCLNLAELLDGVLLVVASERVSAAAAQRGAGLLKNAGANVLGAVLNGHRQHIPNWLERKL
jgi:protein-tyrosine kinase